jgi:hypothetical protein
VACGGVAGGIGNDQGRDPAGVAVDDLLGDVAAEAEPDKTDAFEVEMVEQGDDVADRVLEGELAGPGGGAVATQIRYDQTVLRHQGVDLRIPRLVVERRAVEQHQGRSRVRAAGPVADRGIGADQLALIHGSTFRSNASGEFHVYGTARGPVFFMAWPGLAGPGHWCGGEFRSATVNIAFGDRGTCRASERAECVTRLRRPTSRLPSVGDTPGSGAYGRALPDLTTTVGHGIAPCNRWHCCKIHTFPACVRSPGSAHLRTARNIVFPGSRRRRKPYCDMGLHGGGGVAEAGWRA